jgi:hypothetical protein
MKRLTMPRAPMLLLSLTMIAGCAAAAEDPSSSTSGGADARGDSLAFGRSESGTRDGGDDDTRPATKEDTRDDGSSTADTSVTADTTSTIDTSPEPYDSGVTTFDTAFPPPFDSGFVGFDTSPPPPPFDTGFVSFDTGYYPYDSGYYPYDSGYPYPYDSAPSGTDSSCKCVPFDAIAPDEPTPF